jgi:tetratricopeptide (TPR) repeat protein
VAENTRIEELRRRLDREPGSRLFAQLAEELRKDGRAQEAIRVARAGLAIHTGYTSARLTLGRALLATGELAAARIELEAVVRAAPDNIVASRDLGECLEGLGDLGASLLQYRSALVLAPGDRSVGARIRELESRVGAGRSQLGEAVSPALTPPGALDGSAGATAGPGVATPQPEPPPRGPAAVVGAASRPAEGAAQLVVESGSAVGPPRVGEGPPGVATVGASGAEPEPAAAQDSPVGHAGSGLASVTLAELYFDQGLPERAAEVYRQLQAQDPSNGRIEARLAEIEANVASRGSSAPVRDLGVAPPGRSGAVADRAAVERVVRRLERLRTALRRE